MGPITMIGDEMSCAGFRLAGVNTRSPALADVAAEFARALEAAPLVILSRRCAAALAPQTLRQAMERESPLVVVLPDIADPRPDEGLAGRMRAVLGIGA